MRQIARDVGGVRALADKVGREPGQISHLIGVNPSKPIGEKLAREFEAKAGKSKGWLDKVHGVNDKLLQDIMRLVNAEFKNAGKNISIEHRDRIVSLCYKLVAQYEADSGMVRDVVRLVIER